MLEQWTALGVFPSNGLDRSLHAPVFIGLVLLSFFKETLGWTYAGLVVPGYLATVFLAAPVTGVLVVLESLLTYAVATLLGRVLPRTGAWFTFFGRERFLLIIGVASFVRLFMEASLVPAWVSYLGLSHSRELYSLGLVLVPLLANSFWNAGVVRALPRVCVVTGITYLIVSQILLRFTNFTLSRFQVANESVSLAFLETPHAHIILLMGAVLGARNNVRYGWDYNGILVPALLAVAWYQPTKVVATIVEALVVFKLSLWVLKLPWLSKVLIVGSRRLAVTFAVGFAVKYVLGFALLRWAPSVQMVDLFGFGYLLPSLLAVKFWDKQKILRVLMPTLTVSALAFPMGIAVGYALRLISPPQTVLAASTQELRAIDSLSLELMRGDAAPAPHRTGASYKQAGTYAVGLQLAEQVRGGEFADALRNAGRLHLALGQTAAGDWLSVTPRTSDPNQDALGPRLALRMQRAYGDGWLVVVEPSEVASPTFPIAVDLAERLGAAGIVVRSRLPEVRQSDDTFVQELSKILHTQHILSLRIDGAAQAAAAVLSVVGEVPEDINPAALERRLDLKLQTQTRAAPQTASLLERGAQLVLSRAAAEHAASLLLGADELGNWTLQGDRDLFLQLQQLVGTEPDRFRSPSVSEVRIYGALVQSRLEQATLSPSEWQRALAKSLGLTFSSVAAPGFEGWALYEPVSPLRRGSATWLQRAAAGPAQPLAPGSHAHELIVIAAPRWESGVLGAGLALFSAQRAGALLVHGARPQDALDGSADARRVEGRQAFFQRNYEAWVSRGGQALAVRGMDASEHPSTPLVATYDAEVLSVADGPQWVQPWLGALSKLGLSVAAFDGSAERAGFSASNDPAVAFGRRFAPDSTVVLWLRQDLRQQLAYLASSSRLAANHEQQRMQRLQLPVMALLPAEWLQLRTRCGQAAPGSEPQASCAPALASARCDSAVLAQLVTTVERFVLTRNPLWLNRVKQLGDGCALSVLQPPGREESWLTFGAANQSGAVDYFYPLVREVWAEGLQRVSAAELELAQRLPLRAFEVVSP